MKILWISHFIPFPPKAGLIIRSNGLIKELSKGNQVDLVMFNQPRLMATFFEEIDQGFDVSNKELSKYTNILETLEIPGESSTYSRLWLILKSFFSTMPYTINWLKSTNASNTLQAILKNTQYDLIHFDTISLDPYFKLSQSLNTPCVMDHHNIESHMMERRALQEQSWLKKIYFTWEAKKLTRYEKKELSKYAAHITCSEDDSSRLKNLVPNAISEVVPNGVTVKNASTEYTPKNNSILFVGGLSWYPNLQGVEYLLEEVLPALNKLTTDYELNIIGEGASDALLETYKHDKKIKFLGFVESLETLYNDASAFVAPIFDGGGTKLKVLNALANNIPLVTSTLGCEGIDLIDGTHCLIADDAETMAAKLAFVLNNREQAELLSKAGEKLIKEKYSQEKVGETIRNFYSTVTKLNKS